MQGHNNIWREAAYGCTYFNPDNYSFRGDSQSRIYVDKTGLIEELNKMIGTSERYIALSHARRFGKTQAAGMIDAYYSRGSDSRELFSKYEIAGKPDFEKHLNKYNVIHIDISSISAFHLQERGVKDISCAGIYHRNNACKED